jgi:hypothetical protein
MFETLVIVCRIMSFNPFALARNKKAGTARSEGGNIRRGRIIIPPMATIPAPVIELKRAYYGEDRRDATVEPHEEMRVRRNA